ncbi:unnamed protein product [Symbiodinium natans]|uniref:Uncharacterized protein n=1 Tax=Symbiodinium natans TaxID=878477 RepID=A0A812MMB0_9DINO|nr:unnamed protein product [Symbiodinium natans]
MAFLLACLACLVVGASSASQESASFPGRALRAKAKTKCDGAGCTCASSDDCHPSSKHCIQIGLAQKCFGEAVVNAKSNIGNFEKFADHADLVEHPSALEEVSTWLLHNNVHSVEELASSKDMMGKFLLATHSKVKLRPYYNMRRYLQKDLRKAPPPPAVQNPLPFALGGTGGVGSQ